MDQQDLAADADGTITNVKFYQKLSTAGSRTLVGTGTFACGDHEINWTIISIATGSYALSADATDNSGAITTHTVNITITN